MQYGKSAHEKKMPRLVLLAMLIIAGFFIYCGAMRLEPERLVLDDSAFFKPRIFWDGQYYCGFGVNEVPDCMADWEYVGNIVGVTVERTVDDLMMQADFTVTGEVYANSDCPEALYGKMIFGDRALPAWVRLVTMRHRFKTYVYANGAVYTMQPNLYFSRLSNLADLPPTYRYWGAVQRGNKDRVPDKDCTTNDPDLTGAIWVSNENPGIVYISYPNEGENGYFIPAYNLKLWKPKHLRPIRENDLQIERRKWQIT